MRYRAHRQTSDGRAASLAAPEAEDSPCYRIIQWRWKSHVRIGQERTSRAQALTSASPFKVNKIERTATPPGYRHAG
jgi:hypothetical protein